jgi:hypothetical protein
MNLAANPIARKRAPTVSALSKDGRQLKRPLARPFQQNPIAAD